MGSFGHDKDASLDYGWDWGSWLASGETIVESTWEISNDKSPSLLSLPTNDGRRTGIRVGKGVVIGRQYRLTNHIVTSTGQEQDKTHRLTGQEQ